DGINQSGLYRYVTKPWDPDELIELLHAAAAHYDEIVERRQLLGDLRTCLAESPGLMSSLGAGVESGTGTVQIPDSAYQRINLLDRIEKFLRLETENR